MSAELTSVHPAAALLINLLASHATTDHDWSHRDVKTGKVCRFAPSSPAEAQLHRLLAARTLETGQLAEVRPRARSLETLIQHFMATCVVQAPDSRVSHSQLLLAYRKATGDWDSSASQVAAGVRKLGFTTVRSHGLRHWAGASLAERLQEQ
jgi:hypothetical protein